MKFKLKFENVTKTFVSKRQTITALNNCSFGVYDKEFLSIVGPSGCGKSTIIRIIDNIIEPTEGTITIDNTTYSNIIPDEIRRKIGFVFQSHNLLPWMTVRQNLMLPLKIYNLTGPEWDSQVDTLLEFARLKDKQSIYVNELSLGMQQRLGVIRAMVHNPEILLMDEPFGSLDEKNREQLDMDLLDIWERTGKTIIFITHNISEAILLSSRILVMKTNPGEIVKEFNVPIERPRNPQIQTQKVFALIEDEITNAIGEIKLNIIK